MRHFVGFFLFFSLQVWGLDVLYLTWSHDPTTSMVVQWQTIGQGPSMVRYRRVGEESWRAEEGRARALWEDVVGHEVELEGLVPGTEYLLEVEGEISRFRTVGLEEVRFVVGGDLYQGLEGFERMNRVVRDLGPDFVVLGGDLAYVHWLGKGERWQRQRWRKFLEEWTRSMVDEGGRRIPLIAVLGNHDMGLEGSLGWFSPLFLQGGDATYRALDVGPHLSLYLLDTGHYHAVEGEQTKWLGEALRNRSGVKIPIYHVAAYPSVYREESKGAQMIREHWVPLFEQAGVQVAFEHHNHAFKRTHPLKGVVYLGDGAWGVGARTPASVEKKPYLAKSEKKNHVWQIEVRGDALRAKAIDEKGVIFDEVSSPVVSEPVSSAKQ